MSNITAAEAVEGARNATLEDTVAILRKQQSLKVDVVAPAASLRVKDGSFVLSGLEPAISEEGVTDPNGTYRPTASADGDVAEKLGIGARYIRKLRTERPDLYDLNVNGLLRGKVRRAVDGTQETLYPADERSFMLRLFRGEDGTEGVMRALLSDKFGRVDHLDLIMAILAGIRDAGVEVQIRECDLTEHYMRVRAYSPQVSALAPTLLGNYRNPFANPELEKARQEISRWQRIASNEGMGYDAEETANQVVFAGFEFSNSETGNGAVRFQPRMLLRVCKNGLTLPAFAVKQAHLGSKLEEGWGLEVQNKTLAVITAQAKEKVTEWLSPDFLARRVTEIEAVAGAPVAKPADTMKVLAKRFELTENEQDGILAHFIAGGSITAGGIANAVTSFSQTVRSPERAQALDSIAVTAMELVAAGR
jgi:hypothetical protein